MASFWEQQAQARKNTTGLLFLFALAVVSIVATVTLVAHFAIAVQSSPRRSHDDSYPDVYSQSGVARPGSDSMTIDGLVACFTLVVIGIGTLVRMAQIGGNGTSVALMLGGIPISQATDDPLERRLMNVVEEMAIASSVPVPKVFIMQNEGGINAFAAGLVPSQAVIGITRGTLESLTRDELQGVIAHEFSHIFNGDMKLNLRLIGVLGGILALATVGRLMMRARGKNSGGIVMAGLGLFILGYLGVFFGRLIKSAVSRQREFLADSSAIQYTRNPLGIGGALMKIRNAFSTVSSPYAEEASHMFFGTALNFSSLFATHPPLEERITRISPTLLKPGAWTAKMPLDEYDTTAEDLTSKLAPSPPPKSRPIEDIVKSVGQPQAQDLLAAQQMIQGLPDVLRTELRRVEHAREILLALLFEPGGGSDKQHTLVRAGLGEASLEKAQQF
ncbi:MAG: M48 family metallopeptidase, partial [Bdellovibrionota bacterium]